MTVLIDAGAPQAVVVTPVPLPSERPFDYPKVDDAPDWTWPLVQIVEAGDRRQLQVVGWSKNITNPQLAMNAAQAKARANLVTALQERALVEPGAVEGVVQGGEFARTFRSRSGAVFTAIQIELP